MMKKTLLTLAITACLATAAQAQLTLTALNEAVDTDFTAWNGTLPTGFVATGEDTTYRGSSATTSGGLYDISGFNYQPSGGADNLQLTGTFLNNTGLTITTLFVSYDAFVVVSRDSRLPSWTVTSSAGGDTSSLSWTSTDGTSLLEGTLTGLNIGDGASFSLVWSSDRGTGSGSSPNIGLNNISVTAVPEPHEYALGITALVALVAFARRRRLTA